MASELQRQQRTIEKEQSVQAITNNDLTWIDVQNFLGTYTTFLISIAITIATVLLMIWLFKRLGWIRISRWWNNTILTFWKKYAITDFSVLVLLNLTIPLKMYFWNGLKLILSVTWLQLVVTLATTINHNLNIWLYTT